MRVIILTGAGRGFCAGADMTELGDIIAAGELRADAFEPFDAQARADFQRSRTYFPSVGKPIIAAVNGVAAGLGLATLLFCDLRFCADSAAFLSSFSRRGLIAEHGTSWMLTRPVGHSRAMDILLSSRKVEAGEAFRIGLVDRVVPAAELIEVTRAYARELADLVSPRSLAVIKRQLWDSLFQDLGEAMAQADHEMALRRRATSVPDPASRHWVSDGSLRRPPAQPAEGGSRRPRLTPRPPGPSAARTGPQGQAYPGAMPKGYWDGEQDGRRGPGRRRRPALDGRKRAGRAGRAVPWRPGAVGHVRHARPAGD
ncbi:MAG: enoyl-CoA hydratase-related protein [Actinomycetota bacterium]|nr:enoyl-CoA hydratase-related protein [Actinomycetota bacterium]